MSSIPISYQTTTAIIAVLIFHGNVFYSNFLSNHNKIHRKSDKSSECLLFQFLIKPQPSTVISSALTWMSSIPISYQTTTPTLISYLSIIMSSIPISYQTTTPSGIWQFCKEMSSIPISYQTTTPYRNASVHRWMSSIPISYQTTTLWYKDKKRN